MVKEVPGWLGRHLKTGDFEQIEQAIKKAELGTSGELIPMIVRSSAVTGHVPVIVMLLLVVGAFALHAFDHQQALWGGPFALWVVIDIVIFAVASAWLARFPIVQRLLTSDEDLAIQAEERAEVEFYEHGHGMTTGRSAILIFLSLMERRVVVLGDVNIASKLPKETWDGVIKLVTTGISKDRLAHGFCDGILKCGSILAQHFPRAPDDSNEIKDELIVKE
jgi:putative membrane protein